MSKWTHQTNYYCQRMSVTNQELFCIIHLLKIRKHLTEQNGIDVYMPCACFYHRVQLFVCSWKVTVLVVIKVELMYSIGYSQKINQRFALVMLRKPQLLKRYHLIMMAMYVDSPPIYDDDENTPTYFSSWYSDCNNPGSNRSERKLRKNVYN